MSGTRNYQRKMIRYLLRIHHVPTISKIGDPGAARKYESLNTLPLPINLETTLPSRQFRPSRTPPSITRFAPPFNKLHVLTLQQILIRLALRRRQGTKDDFIGLGGELVCDQLFCAAKHEAREEIIFELQGDCLPISGLF